MGSGDRIKFVVSYCRGNDLAIDPVIKDVGSPPQAAKRQPQTSKTIRKLAAAVLIATGLVWVTSATSRLHDSSKHEAEQVKHTSILYCLTDDGRSLVSKEVRHGGFLLALTDNGRGADAPKFSWQCSLTDNG